MLLRPAALFVLLTSSISYKNAKEGSPRRWTVSSTTLTALPASSVRIAIVIMFVFAAAALAIMPSRISCER